MDAGPWLWHAWRRWAPGEGQCLTWMASDRARWPNHFLLLPCFKEAALRGALDRDAGCDVNKDSVATAQMDTMIPHIHACYLWWCDCSPPPPRYLYIDLRWYCNGKTICAVWLESYLNYFENSLTVKWSTLRNNQPIEGEQNPIYLCKAFECIKSVGGLHKCNCSLLFTRWQWS